MQSDEGVDETFFLELIGVGFFKVAYIKLLTTNIYKNFLNKIILLFFEEKVVKHYKLSYTSI